MTAPKEIVDLVNRFEMHYERYKSPHYNESRKIDALVHELYRLTQEEIKIVEGTSSK